MPEHQVKKRLGVTLRARDAEFRVWAPFAQAVSIGGTFTPDGQILMNSEEDGYWSVILKGVEPGHHYKYYLVTQDGTVLERNDPRARAITSSDKGFSVVVDNDFDWGETMPAATPKNRQVIYELHIGTFNRPDASTAGTFESAIDKLDYLKDLGITTIELMPITSMAFSNGWGYAPNYIFSVESMLGGRFGLMSFVKACHERGMGVLLDVVYNHFYGDTDLWQFDGWQENNRGGIYFYNDSRGDTPWGGRPDYGRPEVRQFILDNITMWFNEYHLDGLRIDSTIYMRNTEGHDNDPDHDLPDAWLLMQDIVELAHKLNTEALIIAEDCANNAYINKSRRDGGCGFDAQWELGFPHALRDALQPGKYANLDSLNFTLERNFNNDTFEKIVFSDSHDTAANGSTRLNDMISPRDSTSLQARQKTLLADAVTLTAPGIPMLLQGSEFLQEGAFNDWQALDWSLPEAHVNFVLAHKHLIDLRTNLYENTTGLTGQSTKILQLDNDNKLISYHRWDRGGPNDDTIIVANFGANTLRDYSFIAPRTGQWMVRFNSSWSGYGDDFPNLELESVDVGSDKKFTLEIPAYCLLIFSQDPKN